jgi:hypothetical protein
MTDVMTKATLSPARRRLIELMQELNYGRIEGLQVQDGEPVFDPQPITLRLFVFGKDNGPNESRGNDSFTLKKKMVELFEIFDRERTLSIQEIIIDSGLPIRMMVASVARV